jgi:hypothetical protein
LDIPKLNNLFPNFLVVGAAKSGTSSLDQYLRQHPNIYMPENIKELNYFHLRGHKDKRAILKRAPHLPTNVLSYLGHFHDKKPKQITGECSPSYLYYYENTIKNIKEIHPNCKDLKIIIVLREPIDKIWSHYRFVRMKNLDPEKLSLRESLAKENSRIDDIKLLPDLHFIENTSYSKQVKAYVDNFDNVKIIKFDDFVNQPKIIMNQIFTFLEIDTIKELNTSKKYNVSTPIFEYKNDIYRKIFTDLPLKLHKFIPQVIKSKFKQEEVMGIEIKIILAKHFLSEITSLEDVTGMSFSNWILKYKALLNNE